ncbi:MAG: glycoside hydrolase family 6 protein [Solirubrobacteraceae bacterium]
MFKGVRAGRRMLAVTAGLTIAVVWAVSASGAGTPAGRAIAIRAHAADVQQCADPHSSTRDQANPLDLAPAPGADPLTGAHFFVDGPAHGAAAGAIVTLLGHSPAGFPDSYSWAQLAASIAHGAFHRQLAGNRRLAGEIAELSKIASEPEVQRVSAYSRGGGPGAVFLQTEKLLCKNSAADPGSIPILNTYFLVPAAGNCPSPAALAAAGPTFRRRVDEFAAAVENRPVVLLLETDALGGSGCVSRVGSLPAWESDLRYEITTLAPLPHAVSYVEAGYSDANSVAYTARALNAIGVAQIRGFYTNDTHLNWTIKEVKWATKISALTHGAHFIVNTAQNGNGPKLNPHPGTQGNEDLCNPPGRALGPRPTTDTGFALADAWLWTSVPGNSSGCGGGPAGGVFWTARAVSLAAHANGRLGPGLPSLPY